VIAKTKITHNTGKIDLAGPRIPLSPQAARIDPGRHTIECGGKIEFEIRSGVLFKFDYWGP